MEDADGNNTLVCVLYNVNVSIECNLNVRATTYMIQIFKSSVAHPVPNHKGTLKGPRSNPDGCPMAAQALKRSSTEYSQYKYSRKLSSCTYSASVRV